MGFLDHSTNNIIVDAVLTDMGRKYLSRQDGSFSVSQFALGDDEVDYNIIKHFGRTSGKDKIEKNTPIMEALTRSNLALKHKLASISNEYLTHFPVLEITAGNLKNDIITLNKRGSTSSLFSKIAITISPKTKFNIENDLIDSELFVEVNNLFLSVVNDSPDIVNVDNTVTYRIPTNMEQGTGHVTGQFVIRLKDFSQTVFNTYSAAGTAFVKTFVKITGINSGLTKIIEVRINNSN